MVYFKNNFVALRYILALLLLLVMVPVYAQDAIDSTTNDLEQVEVSETQVLPTESENIVKKSVTYKPSVVNKYNKLCQNAEKLIDKENYEKALEPLNKAIELCPETDNAYALKSICLRMSNNFEDAKENAQKAYQLNPNNYIALEEKGILTTLDGNYNKAIFFFDKAEQLNKNYARTYANRGFTYILAEEYEKAIADLNTANKLNPNSVFIHSCRADAFLKADKKYANFALADSNFLIQHDSKNMNWYKLRAKSYAYLNNVPMALSDINKVVNNDPENFQSYIDRLNIYEIIKASDRLVLKDIEAAEHYSGNDSDNLMLLATYAIEQKNIILSKRLLSKILNIDPNNNLALYEMAVICRDSHEYDKALDLLNKIDLSSFDNSYLPDLYLLRATVKFGVAGLDNKQLIQEGISDLNMSMKETDKYDYSLLGTAYVANGEYQLGLDNFHKSNELGNNFREDAYWKDVANLKLGKLKSDNLQSMGIIMSYGSNNKSSDDDNASAFVNAFDNTPNNHIAAKINTILFYSDEDVSIISSDKIMKLISKIEDSSVNIERVYEQNGKIIALPYKNVQLDYGHAISQDMKNKIIQQLASKAFAVAVYRSDDDIETPLNKFLETSNTTQKINGLLNVIDDISITDESVLNKIIENLGLYDSSIKSEQDKIKQILRKAYVKLAYGEENNNGIESAMYYYNMAIDLGYPKFEVYSDYASYYYSERDYFSAIKWATQALRVKNSADMFFLRGNSKANLKDYDGAIYDYTKALGYDAKLYDAYFQRAAVYFKQKKWAMAQADYMKYAGYDKTEPSAPFNVATCLQNQGKKQAAITWYEKAKSLYQEYGRQSDYNECVRRINAIKGYKTWW